MEKLIKPLYRCKSQEAGYLLTDDPNCGANGHARDGNDSESIEGYVYREDVFKSTNDPLGDKLYHPLTLWRSEDGRYITGPFPREQGPEGYKFVRLLGYLPRMGRFVPPPATTPMRYLNKIDPKLYLQLIDTSRTRK